MATQNCEMQKLSAKIKEKKGGKVKKKNQAGLINQLHNV